MEPPELLVALRDCAARPMVRRDMAADKVGRARAWLADAEGLIVREERRDRDLGAFYHFLAIQECLDLATQWAADVGWLVPDDAGASFDLLADRGVLDRGLAEGMRGAVGLRNRIGYGYAAIDHERIGRELEQGAQTLRTFLAAVADEAGL